MTTADRYAVAGNPVEHSRSPLIHAQFAQQTGQAVDYGRLLCPLDDFKAHIRAFAAGGAKGCNVTVPFKFEAFELAARRTPRAELAQAANTLRFDAPADGGWLADNTDGIGLVRDITRNAGVPLAGQRVLLLGAGGASAGVLGPLIEARPAEIVMANRTVEKAEAIVARHPNVERVICGHLHRSIQVRFGGTIASTVPAPAHQVSLDLSPQAASTWMLEPQASPSTPCHAGRAWCRIWQPVGHLKGRSPSMSRVGNSSIDRVGF